MSLFSFPCFSPCTYNNVSTRIITYNNALYLANNPLLQTLHLEKKASTKKYNIQLYPANNPLESLKRSLDQVDGGEDPGHVQQQHQSPHLTCWKGV